MAISRYGWHPWILVPTWCPPSIFTNFSWAKSHNFFIMEKPKFTEIFNICWKHVPLILCRSSQFDQMFYISVNFDFCIMKKLWDLAHEKLVNILGGHHVGTNIHGCQPYLEIAIYVLNSANGGLLYTPLYNLGYPLIAFSHFYRRKFIFKYVEICFCPFNQQHTMCPASYHLSLEFDHFQYALCWISHWWNGCLFGRFR